LNFHIPVAEFHSFHDELLRKGGVSLHIAPCLPNAYTSLSSRPLPCLPASSTQHRFHLRKAKCELAVLLLWEQYGLALFLLWHPDDQQFGRHAASQMMLGYSSSVFHKWLGPPSD
jgi:hypothetical protein